MPPTSRRIKQRLAELAKQHKRAPKRVLGPSLEPDTTLRRVSVSKLMCFVECHRKFFWRYVLRLEPKEINIPFFIGGMFHKALEDFYSRIDFDAVVCRCQDRIDEYLGGYFIPPDKVGDVEIQRAVVLGMIRGYMRMYSDDVSNWKVIAREKAMSFRLPNIPLDFMGVVDMLIESGKRLFVCEHKTASKVTKDYVDRLPFDIQAQCYPLFVERCLKKRVAGVCYNVTRKPQIRQKKNERFDQFVERVEDVYIESPMEYFYREDLMYSVSHISAAFLDVQAIAEELWTYFDALSATQIADPKSWYRNSGACFNYNNRCPYYQLCRYGTRSDKLMFFKNREEKNDDQVVKEE